MVSGTHTLSIQEIIDASLKQKERHPSGKFVPSMLGRCYRAQIWYRRNEPISNPLSPRQLRIFKAGDFFHAFVQDIILSEYPEAEKEILVETEDFKGYADLVLKEEVIDIKSNHSRAFWRRNKLTWEEIKKKIYPNILQVIFYAVYLEKPKARLVYISKDDLCIQEYSLKTENYKSKLGVELATLRDFWHYEALPPAKPRAYLNEEGKSRECNFCRWQDKCKEIESKEVKSEK